MLLKRIYSGYKTPFSDCIFPCVLYSWHNLVSQFCLVLAVPLPDSSFLAIYIFTYSPMDDANLHLSRINLHCYLKFQSLQC
jgi:hypothetical protein